LKVDSKNTGDNSGQNASPDEGVIIGKAEACDKKDKKVKEKSSENSKNGEEIKTKKE